MKRVLGIIGSPRKLGNSEIIIKEISRQIPEPHTLELLRIADFDVKACKGCYACLFHPEGLCRIEDDFTTLLDAVCRADALIVSVPVYLLSANAALKTVLDRGLCFYGRARELWGKPAVGVAVAGMEGKEGFGKLGVDNFLHMLLADVKASVVLYGALPGEIVRRERNLVLAKRLGAALFGERLVQEGPRCPVCNGDTFRFLPGHRVRCMLCSNEGKVDVSDGQVAFRVESGGHRLFLSAEDALSHRDWLRGMKKRYSGLRQDLRRVASPYLQMGEWVKPALSLAPPDADFEEDEAAAPPPEAGATS